MLTNDLPWQIDLLIIETLVSMVVAMLMLHQRVTRLSMTKTFLFLCWSVACVVLILWGGSLSWQHLIILVAETWAVAQGIRRMQNDGWIGSEKTRRSIADEGLTAGTAFFGSLMSFGIILLLVTGVR